MYRASSRACRIDRLKDSVCWKTNTRTSSAVWPGRCVRPINCSSRSPELGGSPRTLIVQAWRFRPSPCDRVDNAQSLAKAGGSSPAARTSIPRSLNASRKALDSYQTIAGYGTYGRAAFGGVRLRLK